MSLNPVDIIIGAVRGAAAEALPGAIRQAVANSPVLPAAAAPALDVDAIARAVEERLRANPAVQDAREAAQPIVWWQSPVVLGQISAIIGLIVSGFGWQLAPQDLSALTAMVGAVLAGIPVVWGLFSRLFSRAQPVTATRTEAGR